MIKFDYHMHSRYSIDSSATIDTLVTKAIDLGLKEIAITDHVDFEWPSRKKTKDHTAPIDFYARAVLDTKKQYAPKIKVLLGLEFGLRADCADIGAQIASSHDFDFIIGSMHDTEGVGFHSLCFFYDYDINEAYNIYLENILATVKACDCFDVLGHLGYAERYAKRHKLYEDYRFKYEIHKNIIDEILKTLITKGKGIEINTAGYSYGLDNPHPHIEVVRRYKALGGEVITIGSDAHGPQTIAQNFDLTLKFLEDAGVDYITSFEKRRPRQVAIDC